MKSTAAVALTLAFSAAAWGCAEASDEAERAGPPDEAVDTTAATDMPAEAAGVALAVDSMDGMAYLTDGAGRALYLLEGEPRDSVTCYEECAREWPPFAAAQGEPTVESDAVREDLISIVTRREGRNQIAYAGHPLYYYHDDRQPGDTKGQDVTDDWGEWYLVTPDGEPMRH